MNNRTTIPYNQRLSEYPNKGICGLPESEDSQRAMKVKVDKLIKLIRESKHTVVLTGAGISTNAGIRDFRGPNGLWTKEEKDKNLLRKQKSRKRTKKNKNVLKDDEKDIIYSNQIISNNNNLSEENIETKQPSLNKRGREGDEAVVGEDSPSMYQHSFESATPTITHRSITRLVQLGLVEYVITQNVDGLHRRSGLSRSKLAVLHGCLFTEICEKCKTEYFRNFDIGGVSFQKTGRYCTELGCSGELQDTILDWEDELPVEDWALSQDQCQKSDLILAIGTSLRIEPAGSLPTLGRKYVIINKQVTPYDSNATLIIRADVDTVFLKVMKELDEEWIE